VAITSPVETRVLWLMRDDGDMTEPMNIMLLSALGKHQKPWRSSHLALLERDDAIQAVKELKPRVVAASAITGSHRSYLSALKAIKEKFGDSVFTVFGGPYCSTYPEAIAENPFLDAIGVFECDDAWPEFLDALENNPDGVHSIPNIITQENRAVVLRREPIGDGRFVTFVDRKAYRDRRGNFDALPFMDRSLIYEHTAFNTRPKRTHMAGRGCPFRCTYCFERDWNDAYSGKGQMLQRYSPERFCAELRDVMARWDTRFWKFYDDVFPTFPTDLEWLREFAEVYRRTVGLPFHCLTRCDLVARKPETLQLLKAAGIASITMSIESGNSFIRDHVVVRDMSEEQIAFAFAEAKKLGIHTFSNTILGIPAPKIPCLNDPRFSERVSEICEDTKRYGVSRGGKMFELAAIFEAARSWLPAEADWRKFIVDFLRRGSLRANQLDYDRESCDFNVQLGVSFGEFPILHPYPRTEATNYLVRKGFFDGNFDKLHGSYQNRSPLACFTEREKTVQQNLALLTTFVMLFSGSRSRFLNWLSKPVRKICLDWLSRLPFRWATFIFEQLYALSKSWMHERRIYSMKRSFWERIRFYLEMWRLDFWKQFGSKKQFLRGSRPGQTLGGPPSV